MPDVIHKFGAFVDRQVPEHPVAARNLLVAGFRAFGFKLDFRPDKRLPKSRQYVASLLNDVVVDMLTHPSEAALTSIFMPCELLQAGKIRPLCAEVYSTFINGAHAEKAFAEAAEEAGIAETYCSYHKILLGSAYAGVLPKPGFIVNTSMVCDANNLTFRALSDYYKIPQFYLDVPPYADGEATAYVADQLRELRTFLEDQSGHEITEQSLKEHVDLSRRTITNLKLAQPIRRDHWLEGDIASELYELYVTHIGLGTPEAEKYSRLFLHDIGRAPSVKEKRGLRILWIHTIPNWQIPVRDTFNFSDKAQIIGCDMNWDALIDLDPEKPYESMARRLTESAWNGSGEKRIDNAVAMAKKLNADGAIVFCHWGCKETMGLSVQFKSSLEAEGFPTLILNGDGCDESNSSDGQVATRLDAYMEMLRQNKEAGQAAK